MTTVVMLTQITTLQGDMTRGVSTVNIASTSPSTSIMMIPLQMTTRVEVVVINLGAGDTGVGHRHHHRQAVGVATGIPPKAGVSLASLVIYPERKGKNPSQQKAYGCVIPS